MNPGSSPHARGAPLPISTFPDPYGNFHSVWKRGQRFMRKNSERTQRDDIAVIEHTFDFYGACSHRSSPSSALRTRWNPQSRPDV